MLRGGKDACSSTHTTLVHEHTPCSIALLRHSPTRSPLVRPSERSQVWGFETLTSEQLRPGEGREEGAGNGDNGGSSALYRKRGRVYPETGCALDNLTL